MISLPSGPGSWSRDPASRVGRVGDLLHADDDVHGRDSSPSDRFPPTRRRPGTVDPPHAPPAAGELVGVVGHRRGDGWSSTRRCRPTTICTSPRPAGGGTPPAWPSAPPPTASRSSWPWVATAPSTRRPTAWPGPHSALAVLPGGSTNVFARSIGLANDPIEATGQLLDRPGPAGFDPTRRAGLAQRALLPLQRRRGLRRRRHRPRRAARRAQALGRPPAVRVHRLRRPGSAPTTAAVPAWPWSSPTGHGWPMATSPLPRTPTPTPISETARSGSRPTRPWTGASRWPRSARSQPFRSCA